MTSETLNTMLQNATQAQITAAYRELVGMDDENRMGRWKGYGCYQQHINLSEANRAIVYWIESEADKIQHGLATVARLCGATAKQREMLSAIEQRAIDALAAVGVSKEKSARQLASESAFASCGGTIRTYG